MIILQDDEIRVIIERLFVLEKLRKQFRDTDKYGRTLAEKLELQFSHCEGQEL